MVVAAFLLSLPTFALPTSRTWLKVHGWLVMACALFTLVLGLMEWITTLTTRANLEAIWGQQTPEIQSMLQQKVCYTFNIAALKTGFITGGGALA